MTNDLNGVWDKLTPAQQDDFSQELSNMLSREINIEIIAEIKRATARDKLGNKLK